MYRHLCAIRILHTTLHAVHNSSFTYSFVCFLWKAHTWGLTVLWQTLSLHRRQTSTTILFLVTVDSAVASRVVSLVILVLITHCTSSCIFIAFPLYWPFKALYKTCHIDPFTHTFIHWWQRLPCKVPTAHQEQFGVQYLAQGHFNMQMRVGGGIWTPITRRPALPLELQPPLFTHLGFIYEYLQDPFGTLMFPVTFWVRPHKTICWSSEVTPSTCFLLGDTMTYLW